MQRLVDNSQRASLTSQGTARPLNTGANFNQENNSAIPSMYQPVLSALPADVMMQLLLWTMKQDTSEASARALRCTSHQFDQMFMHYVENGYYKKFLEDSYIERSNEFVTNVFSYPCDYFGKNYISDLDDLKKKINILGRIFNRSENGYINYLCINAKFVAEYDDEWIKQFQCFKGSHLPVAVSCGTAGLEVVAKINQVLPPKVALQLSVGYVGERDHEEKLCEILSVLFSSGRPLGLEFYYYLLMPHSARKLVLEAMCEPKIISYIKFSDVASDLILDELVNRWSDFRDVQLVVVEYETLRYSRMYDGREPNIVNRKLLTKSIEKISSRDDQLLPPIPLLLQSVDDDKLSAELYGSQASRSRLEQLNFFFLQHRDSPDLKTVEAIQNSLKSLPEIYSNYQLLFRLTGDRKEFSQSKTTALKPASPPLDSEDSSILVSSASDSEDETSELSDEIKVVSYSRRDAAFRSTQNRIKTVADQSDEGAPKRKIKPKKAQSADKTRSRTRTEPARSAPTNHKEPARRVMESTEPKIKKRDRCVIS
jgi:hypothetical protein